MFGIGMPELLLILALALIVIGPKKLPDIARALGKGLAEFRRATDDLKSSIQEESRTTDTRDRLLREGKIKAPGSSDAAPVTDAPVTDAPVATTAAAETESTPATEETPQDSQNG